MAYQSPRAPRDKRGWLIPREGTKSRKIYDFLVSGRRFVDPVRQFGVGRLSFTLTSYRIQHPNEYNRRKRQMYEAEGRIEVQRVCVSGHDKCYLGPDPDCSYCETRRVVVRGGAGITGALVPPITGAMVPKRGALCG